jgi:malate synthase
MPTIDITGPMITDSGPDGRRVFTPDALRFVGDLEARFGPVRTSLLQARRTRDAEIKAGASYGLLAETESVRRGSWKVASTPADLQRRHV